MMSLNGKTALVTGAASGFGFEFSKLLASDGYELVLVDINETGLSETSRYLKENYKVPVRSIVLDLAAANAASELYSKCRIENIEILINNAGYGLFGFFYNTNWESEERMIYLHVFTTTQLTKLFLRDMIEKGCGRIMTVSSIAAFQPGPLMAVYYATKAYILYFTEALANEVKGTGVSVTVFCPGQTKTGFQQAVADKSNSVLSKSPWLDNPKKTARYGYDAMKSGMALAIPGKRNKFLVQLHRVIPRKTATWLVRKLQEKIRKTKS
jgi:uncharacterized protein